MQIFKNKEDYSNWINSQQWYQSIDLKYGLRTPGNFPTYERASFFSNFDFKDKTVLDIGCNSGQYSFFAKDQGADEVLGVDILEKRIKQAQIIAINEGYDIKFEKRGVFDLDPVKDKRDVVLCIAVLTEMSDFFGALDVVKKCIGEYALIELDVAKPLLYLSRSRYWLLGNKGKGVSRQKSIAEMRYSKTGGWVVSPTIEVIKSYFGNEYSVEIIPNGLRYDMIKVTRK